ncbi:MAG: alpha/beta fold hydrolase [Myxococcota bacterium]|nr:alpha/beta fold hydrolase [Myxococcota bacterium]
MARRLKILCLHGFLGLPADWEFLGPALAAHGVDAEISALDLWSFSGLSLTEVVQRVADLCTSDEILLGYSMGGRIALMACFAALEKPAGLGIVSAHYGGLTPGACSDRQAWDEAWAKRFELGNWHNVLADWSKQPVFSGGPGQVPIRDEARFDRQALAHALRAWSVAHQPDQRPNLAQSNVPILWLAGEQDTKYMQVANHLSGMANNALKVRIVKGAGHRLPWQAPDVVAQLLAAFITSNNLMVGGLP